MSLPKAGQGTGLASREAGEAETQLNLMKCVVRLDQYMTLVSTGPQRFSGKVQGFACGSLLPPRTDFLQTEDLAETAAGGQQGSLWIPRAMVTQATGTRGSWAGAGMSG